MSNELRSEYEHGQIWITPSGEYAVLMSYDFHARSTFLSRADYLSMKLHEDLYEWLDAMGPKVPHITNLTCDIHPWRHRPFIPGSEGLHAFFFYRRRNASLFKLRWT